MKVMMVQHVSVPRSEARHNAVPWRAAPRHHPHPQRRSAWSSLFQRGATGMVDDAARHATALRRAKLRGKETCRAITHICHLKQIPKLVSFPGFLHV